MFRGAAWAKGLRLSYKDSLKLKIKAAKLRLDVRGSYESLHGEANSNGGV